MSASDIFLFLKNIQGVGVRTDSLVIRNGFVVGSAGYPSLEAKWSSASKIWYATFAMLLVQNGTISSLDEPIGKYFSTGALVLTAADKNITWRQLMNMESGYAHADQPGERFAYNDRAIELFVEALKRAHGIRDLNTIGRTRLSALQFSGNLFNDTDRSIANLHDFAKLLHLLLNRGFWKKRVIIDERIIADVFSKMAMRPISNGSNDAEGYLNLPKVGNGANQTRLSRVGPGEYVCNAWMNTQGKMGMPADLVQANGNWGRTVVVFVPSLQLIAVTRIIGYFPNEGDDRLNHPYNGVIIDHLYLLKRAVKTNCPPIEHVAVGWLPGVLYDLLDDDGSR